ncbi:voltage-gated chloride channel family protein [Chamaesiphon polymorphus]|uniref:Chloride channel protein n=1 Tax=Chamaesiphon polymorphus CCALA 037 TaxID=2107692 RepID=A0A2T1GEW7_9CYAN|nr:voltage-gated chloride channel family protein [Chamaesiphon polymorphus]PSB56104.1 chloride channel protein [Chamaesiphon polymorphus CCALA 037]
MNKWLRLEPVQAVPYLLKWLAIGCTIGILTGTSSAALLAALDWATQWRESHRWILFLLPLGGLSSGLIYHYLGSSVEAGNNLLLEEIHDPRSIVPLRMAPLVLLGTTIAHLLGASVGREGTAVQMGASLADSSMQVFRLHGADRRIILMAGISGGVASVFGTPLAGMVFGLEVLAFGHFRYDGLFPCAIAAIIGDRVTLAWGRQHTVYQIPNVPELTIWGLISTIIAGTIFGLTAMVFATLTHRISAYFKAKISYPPLRPFIGGIIIAIAIQILGTTKYIGLGIPTIVSAFNTQLPPWDFAAKIGFTALSLGSGFKGGEVTPLFYIGATLGNALAPLTNLPAPLLAGMGFVGVFAGAANTPLASTLMAIDLFGANVGIYAAIACICSYLCSGHAGIYRAQRVGLSKYAALKHHEGKSIAGIEIDRSTDENSQ